MAREITYNNFETSLVVFMPNMTPNHAITYTNLQFMKYISACFDFRDELFTKQFNWSVIKF